MCPVSCFSINAISRSFEAIIFYLSKMFKILVGFWKMQMTCLTYRMIYLDLKRMLLSRFEIDRYIRAAGSCNLQELCCRQRQRERERERGREREGERERGVGVENGVKSYSLSLSF